jgi:hypothetical protein
MNEIGDIFNCIISLFELAGTGNIGGLIFVILFIILIVGIIYLIATYGDKDKDKDKKK